MKRIDVKCGSEIKDILVRALLDYTEVAFPRDGTDCVLVARESLLDSVKNLELEFDQNGDGRTGYNKRLRAMAKEAIRLHIQLAEAETGQSMAHQRELLLEVVSGIPHDDADLSAARAADQLA